MNESEQGEAELKPLSTHVTAQMSAELESAIVRNPLIVSPDSKVIDAIVQMSGVRTRCATQRPGDDPTDDDIHLRAVASCVLVLNDGKLQGILTEKDVVLLSTRQLSLEKVRVQEIMSRKFVTLRQSAFTDVFSAIDLLNHHGIRHLPILDDQDHLVGLVTHESLQQMAHSMDLLRVRQVSEVMTRRVVWAEGDCSMLTIAQQMTNHRVSSIVIVQTAANVEKKEQIPIGILTRQDIIQFFALDLNLENYAAQSLMSAPVFMVKPDDSLWAVHLIMERRLIRRLVVTDERGELLGIVTQTDLLQALNPLEIYKFAKGLEQRVLLLEAEKFQELARRNIELEQQVEARTRFLKQKIEREQLIAEIATQVRSSLSLQAILETTVMRVRQFLGCDRVTIWQFEADGQGIAVAESTDSPRSLIGERLPGPCLNPDLLALNETDPQDRIRVVPDIYRVEMADCHRETLIQLQIRAKILVPLLCGNDLWGWLNATESHHAREWQPEAVELLQALSVQLAIALQQATTYEQLQKQFLELQEAEDRLRESEHRYITLTAAAPVGIFRADAAGRCTYVNDRWCQIAGLTPETAAGDRWRQGLHPDDRAAIAAEWDQSAQENHPFCLEYRFQRPDGTVTWVYGQSVVEKDAQGQVMGYVGTITDISDRKQAEEALKQLNQDLEAQVEQRTAALRASEATNRATLEAIPDLLLRLRRDGTCLDYIKPSIGAEHFLPIGQHLSEVIPPDLLQQQLHIIEQAITTQTLQVYEHHFLKNGHLTYEEVRILALNRHLHNII